MDLDIVSSVRVETLCNAVDSVLTGRALLASLMPAGIVRLSSSRPKQTETTQRWKVGLVLAGGESLPTKVEFSRRKDKIDYSVGIPDPDLLRRYRMPPFAAQYYDATAMAAQKTAALASPARNALRDLFDLHHLLFIVGVKPAELSKRADPAEIEAAADKVGRFTFLDFKEQVLPYLPDELIGLHHDPVVFEKQKEEVERALLEILA
jgi:hypothetical protein